MEYEKMSREELISTNKRLYARIKDMKHKSNENVKRNKILEKSSIKYKDIIFKPRKTNIVKIVEKIVSEYKIQKGDLFGYQTIAPGITWKLWFSLLDYSNEFGKKAVFFIVIKNKCYRMSFVSISNQEYEGLENKIMPSYVFVLGTVRHDFEIKAGLKVTDIPISSNGYGICYYNFSKE